MIHDHLVGTMVQKNFLIVEDEFIVAMDLQRVLERLGYTVCGLVNSGEKALEHLQRGEHVDLVLMDIVLRGEMTGIEAASSIRSQFHVPVVYVTANADKTRILDKAKTTEPFGFIIKPFRERELQANIEMALYKHQMEEKLRESEEKYRQVVNNANETILVVQDGRIVFANPEATKISGYSSEELLKMPSFFDVIDTADREKAMRRYLLRMQGLLVSDPLSLRVIRKDGACRWIENRAVRIQWEEHPAILAFLNDITDRVSAEEELKRDQNQLEKLVRQRTSSLRKEIQEHQHTENALRQSERRFRELTELLPQLVFEIDRTGTFTYSNRWGFELTGYSQEEFDKGLTAFQVVAPKDHVRMKYNITRTLGGAPLEPHEYTIMKKDGSSLPVLIYTSSIIRDAQPVGLRGVAFDLTERREIEEQLAQSQKMAALGHMAGGIAHDFNTLLGVILGHGELICDDIPDDAPVRDNVEEIIEAAHRAKVLIRQLLDFARPSKADREPIFPGNIVNDALKILRTLLPQTVSIQKPLKNLSDTIFANANQIVQVIINLGMNAGDAIGEREGTLGLTLENVEVDPELASFHAVQAGAYIQLHIADTGCGMPPDVLSHIFEPFFTTKKIGKGTGLGLSVVHGIIKAHGGFITVESQPGNGSSFLIYLPKMRDKQLDT